MKKAMDWIKDIFLDGQLITRRDFLRKCFWMTATTGLIGVFSRPARLFAGLNSSKTSLAPVPDLVGVTGGEPVSMFMKGIEALGGMGRFVKSGETVLVKPNIGWDKTYDTGANTAPELVGIIVRSALEAGAAKVWVLDHTCNNWQACYKNSGIEKAVVENGGVMVAAHAQKYYRQVDIKGSRLLKDALVHEKALDADRFINVPVLKHHGSARVTISMKNLMGIVYDRWAFHQKGLHECIADFAAVRKSDLVVVDAYRVMLQNGPRGISSDDTVLKRMQVLSTDMVAADAAAAKIFGIEPAAVPYIRIAHKKGIGRMDVDNLKIKRIKLNA